MKLPITALLTLLAVLVGGLLTAPAQAVPAVAAAPAVVAVPAGADGTATARAAVAPAVGQCRAYTFRQAQKRTESSAPVACETPHTGLTVAVVPVKKLGSDRAVGRAARTCLDAVRTAVGPALAQTAYGARYFLPTKAERRLGASTLRCDAVLIAGRALAPLPTPLVTAPLPDTTALCAVTKGRTTLATVCSAKHQYRFSASFQAKGKRYPGQTALLTKVVKTCAKKVRTPKKFWAFYPDKVEWNAGFREVSCLSRSKK